MGYAGGVVNTVPVAAGGFAPYAILFDIDGNEIAADNGGHCATTGADPSTGNCDDPVIVESLGTGGYTLAMSVGDNVPFDGFLPDGFTQTGNPGFTCAEFGQAPASFAIPPRHSAASAPPATPSPSWAMRFHCPSPERSRSYWAALSLR